MGRKPDIMFRAAQFKDFMYFKARLLCYCLHVDIRSGQSVKSSDIE